MTGGRTFVRRRGTTVVPNSTVFDVDISFTALGVLTFLLARPERAPQGYRALLGRGLGQKAILATFKELGAAGYRHQIKVRHEAGRVITHTVVSEDPISDETARNYLRERLSEQPHRADTGNARSDLRKHHIAAGRTVRDVPSPGGAGLGEAPHLSNESQGVDSLRSQHRENQTREHAIPANFRERIPRPASAKREAEQESGHG